MPSFKNIVLWVKMFQSLPFVLCDLVELKNTWKWFHLNQSLREITHKISTCLESCYWDNTKVCYPECSVPNKGISTPVAFMTSQSDPSVLSIKKLRLYILVFFLENRFAYNTVHCTTPFQSNFANVMCDCSNVQAGISISLQGGGLRGVWHTVALNIHKTHFPEL